METATVEKKGRPKYEYMPLGAAVEFCHVLRKTGYTTGYKYKTIRYERTPFFRQSTKQGVIVGVRSVPAEGERTFDSEDGYDFKPNGQYLRVYLVATDLFHAPLMVLLDDAKPTTKDKQG